MNTAILLVGHGTKDELGTQEFNRMVEKIRKEMPFHIVEYGFLELAEPTIETAIERCHTQGVQTIIAIPILLLAAGHVKEDIPKQLRKAHYQYPHIEFKYGGPLHLHSNIIQLSQQRINESLQFSRKETMLIVVGRGSRDLEANSDVYKLSRMLWESLQFSWAEVGYLAMASPSLEETLEKTVPMGYSNVLLFPFLIFHGYLFQKVQTITTQFNQKHPQIKTIIAPYLNAHPLLCQTVIERIEEIMETQNSKLYYSHMKNILV